jgi:hypothetical protein
MAWAVRSVQPRLPAARGTGEGGESWRPCTRMPAGLGVASQVAVRSGADRGNWSHHLPSRIVLVLPLVGQLGRAGFVFTINQRRRRPPSNAPPATHTSEGALMKPAMMGMIGTMALLLATLTAVAKAASGGSTSGGVAGGPRPRPPSSRLGARRLPVGLRLLQRQRLLERRSD